MRFKPKSVSLAASIILVCHGMVCAGCGLAYPEEEVRDSILAEISAATLVWGRLDSVDVTDFRPGLAYSIRPLTSNGSVGEITRNSSTPLNSHRLLDFHVTVDHAGYRYTLRQTLVANPCPLLSYKVGDEIPVLLRNGVPEKIMVRYRLYMGRRMVRSSSDPNGFKLK